MRHAYLIIAHNKFDQLNNLLHLLDDEHNEIFLHVDKKTQFTKEMISKLDKSAVHMVNRYSVAWGGYSQIKVELALLDAALKVGGFDYFHLLSGIDMPIKPMTEILNFFEEHNGEEFIEGLTSFDKANSVALWRSQFYWLWQERVGPGLTSRNFILKLLQRFLLYVQKFVGVNRWSGEDVTKLAVISNWFSITSHFAEYIVSKKSYIESHFKYTSCCDEVFISAVLPGYDNKHMVSSEYGNCRYIKFYNGESRPRVLMPHYEEELRKSTALYARKFDFELYPQTKDMIKRLTK